MNSKSHLCGEYPDFRMPSLDILDPCEEECGTASLPVVIGRAVTGGKVIDLVYGLIR